jgi:hypothetical protein
MSYAELAFPKKAIFEYLVLMKNIKDELQHIIFGDEQIGRTSQLKKIQTFLRRYAETSSSTQNQKRFKSEETAELINFVRYEKALL